MISDNSLADGVFKIVARPWREDVALALASHLEIATGGRVSHLEHSIRDEMGIRYIKADSGLCWKAGTRPVRRSIC